MEGMSVLKQKKKPEVCVKKQAKNCFPINSFSQFNFSLFFFPFASPPSNYPSPSSKSKFRSHPTADIMKASTADMVHRAGVNLIRNCDLPPPQKVFRSGMEEKLELLKALRLSQTRAREAERKAAKLMEERDCVSRAFEDEARLMFCYRQSVKLLELRVSKLQKEAEEEEDEEEEERDKNGGSGGMKWVWALAICLSVVGVGFLLGYTCNAS